MVEGFQGSGVRLLGGRKERQGRLPLAKRGAQVRVVSTYLMFSKAVSSDALSTSVDMVAMGMKLTANATPMPARFAIVDPTHQVQHDAAETIFSEHKCHRTPFALSTKRSSSPAQVFVGVFHHRLG